jgi:hypothetical protein
VQERCDIVSRLEAEHGDLLAGFASGSFTVAAFPEIVDVAAHLRDVLGDQTYESLARRGETMTAAAIAAYTYDQIDQARIELNGVLE